MRRKLAIAAAAVVAVLAVGSTVAWAATRGGGPFEWGQMQRHMQSRQPGPHMSQAQMLQMMERVHLGFDEATAAKLVAQCTKAWQNGTMPMHDPDELGPGMMGGTTRGWMMGGSGSGPRSGYSGMTGSGGMMG